MAETEEELNIEAWGDNGGEETDGEDTGEDIGEDFGDDPEEDSTAMFSVALNGWEESDSDEETRRSPGPWISDSGSVSSFGGWGRDSTPQISGRGEDPYEDDDLGWKSVQRRRGWDHSGYGSGYPSNWVTAQGAPVEDPALPTASAAVNSLRKPSYSEPHCSRWANASVARPPHPSNKLPAGQIFLFAEVLADVVPPIELIPVGSFWKSNGIGARALEDITNIQKTCQLWNITAKALGTIWGAFVPAARSELELAVALERTRGANLRLSYRADIPKAVTDALLPRATAVYAGRESPWRNFGRILQRRLPLLEVLILHPSTRSMPRTPLRLFVGALDAPLMRICEIWGPMLLIAPRLERLGLRFCTPAQLALILSGIADVPLVRLVLERIRVERRDERMDLTDIMRSVRRDRLRFVRIVGSVVLSAGLNVDGPRLSFPVLTTLDVGGPMWMTAPNVTVAKIFNATADEALCMLDGLTRVETLHLRGRSEWDLAAHPMVDAAHHVVLPVALQHAKKLLLAGIMSEDTVTLLRGIRTPGLEYLTVYCNMPAAPRHDVLGTARTMVANALDAAQADTNSGALNEAILAADSMLRRGGHRAMSLRLSRIVGFPSVSIIDSSDTTWMSLESAARLTLEALDEASQQPPAVHNGFLLRRVVSAALIAGGVMDPLQDEAEIQIARGRGSVHFWAVVRGSACTLEFVMPYSTTNEWPTSDWRERLPPESTTFGFARMLFGLAGLKPLTMQIDGDPLGPLPGGFGDADERMLREVLRSYDRMVVLRLDYSRLDYNDAGFHFLSALSDPTTMPGLKGMHVVCAPPLANPIGEYIGAHYMAPEYNGPVDVLSAVVNALTARCDGGEMLSTLELEGSFCLAEDDAEAALNVVENFQYDAVKCIRPGGGECIISVRAQAPALMSVSTALNKCTSCVAPFTLYVWIPITPFGARNPFSAGCYAVSPPHALIDSISAVTADPLYLTTWWVNDLGIKLCVRVLTERSASITEIGCIVGLSRIEGSEERLMHDDCTPSAIKCRDPELAAMTEGTTSACRLNGASTRRHPLVMRCSKSGPSEGYGGAVLERAGGHRRLPCARLSAMAKGKINGKRETFMMRFLSDTVTSGKQTQKGNIGQQDVYLNCTRALVLAFGYENPLTNEEPGDFVNVAYKDIPAAEDMPALENEEEEEKRDSVIASLLEPVKTFYKNKRNQARKGDGQARLDMKHIQRFVDAFGPAPLPGRELDTYQKYYRQRYASALEKMWEEKDAAVDGDEKALAKRKKDRGGEERAFASQQYGRESEQVKAAVRARRDKEYKEAMADYNALWGAPLDMPGDSRAWTMPEASAALQAFLSWIATRFGVAVVLMIAGIKDDGSPECHSLFAAGECKPGAPELSDAVARTLSETKIKMSQFARDMMTGRFPTGAPPRERVATRVEEEGGPDVDDMNARLQKDFDNDPMRLMDKQEEAELAGNFGTEETLIGAGNNQGSGGHEGSHEEREVEVDLSPKPNDVGGPSQFSDKGKAVDRSKMVSDWRLANGQGAGQEDMGAVGPPGDSPGAFEYRPMQASAFRPQKRTDHGWDLDEEDEHEAGLGRGYDAAFANTFEGVESFTGNPFPWTQQTPPRSFTPETSSSVYKERRDALSQSPGGSVRDDDRQGSQAGVDMSDEEMREDGAVTDSDVEAADAYASSLYKDRRQRGTKEKNPRTLLLGAVGRSRGAESRKREKLPPKTGDKSDSAPVQRKVKNKKPPLPKLTLSDVIQTANTADVGFSQPEDVPFSPPPAPRRKAGRLRVSSPVERHDEDHHDGPGDAQRVEAGGLEDMEVDSEEGMMRNMFDSDVERTRTKAWMREHADDSSNAEPGSAWKGYMGKVAGVSRRATLVNIMEKLSPTTRPVYADLVDSMEVLLKADEKWDIGAGGQLDRTNRPSLVTQMVNKRGGLLAEAVPQGWGAGVSTWWLTLQPKERGTAAGGVRDLAAPTKDMDWGSLGQASGYKGAFLLVWCMMYWAESGVDLEAWMAVADDMTVVFKVLHAARVSSGLRAQVAMMASKSTQDGRNKSAPLKRANDKGDGNDRATKKARGTGGDEGEQYPKAEREGEKRTRTIWLVMGNDRDAYQ
ncbi:hypothetical protein PENSPDRAFT_664728 [Peniophora sp. CONT]|nr:hypothetical protein PENSPDRAFT_664728 [Peniophora sp. CONT]